MRRKLLEVLGCPRCRGELDCIDSGTDARGEVLTGSLNCRACDVGYPIQEGIPRFVPSQSYASSFGYQWNLFRKEQLDSANGTRLSARRFISETGWSADWLKGKWILDAGCGAGRFLDVASAAGAEVVGVDISSAVDAARANLAGRENVHLVQASIYDLPFRRGVFDGCYCIGVIQHTPEPQNALRSLPAVLKEGAPLAVTIYERRPLTTLAPKYLLRRVTRRMQKEQLLEIVRRAMPVLFPITDVLFRIPVLGRGFRFAIPVANWVDERELTRRQRYAWALLDTFDALSPEYDQPQTQHEVEAALSAAGMVGLERVDAAGVVIVGRKGAEGERVSAAV
jgi:2-polyprenyl-3-methyl-5-hydroxy-6-metoxy-1,4-benzoquinol methylase/uncharacterized protein YbaR (Trm112 family)